MRMMPGILLLAAACEPVGMQQPGLFLSKTVPTVVTGTWTGEGESVSLVALDKDGAEVSRWPAELGDDGAWRAVTLGLHPSTTYCFRVDVLVDGETLSSECVEQSTGGLPDALEPLVVDENTRNDGFFATGVITTTPWAVIYDAEGVPVWWWAVAEPTSLVTRVRRAADGRSLLVNAFEGIGVDPDSEMHIYRVAFDGELVEDVVTVGAHHDYVELPDGGLAWLSYESRDEDGELHTADLVVERDAEGATREVWNAFDWYDWRDYETEATSSFLHANVLNYDVDTDRYWLSLRNPGAYIAIDRASGDIVETLLGPESDVRLLASPAPSHPHGFRWLDDETILLMDNRDSQDEVSRVARYTVDREAALMAQEWSFASDQGIHLLGLGDAAALPGGDVVALWSTAGQIQRLDADDTTVWRATASIGTAFTYLEWSDSLDTLPWP